MFKRLRVLVVEDSREDADLLLQALRGGDHEIEHACVQTAEEMLAALDGSSWDIILSDYSTPKFSAPRALEVLKTRSVEIPFIIVSSTTDEEAAVNAIKAGADDFLVKRHLERLWPAVEHGLRAVEARRQRRAAEQALEQNERQFRMLVESLNDVVFSLSRDMRYDGLFGNARVCKGLANEYVIGQTPHSAHKQALERALNGEANTYEWVCTQCGAVRHFENSVAPRHDTDGDVTGVVGIIRDITEWKRVQALLATADRMASLGMLAAGLGHEINNPLAALLSNLEVALRNAKRMGANPLAAAEFLELLAALSEAHDAALRVGSIVQDLKLFSRESESGETVDINQVLEASLRVTGNEIRHRARLIKDLRPVPHVEANESRLGQVFLNLLTNAAQAINEGHAQTNVIRVVTRCSPEGEVVVEIHDTGCGIDPADMERLFAPFFTTKPVGVGTGLGLSICHHIVTSYRGRIAVESQPGRGSTFRVTLPATARKPMSAPPASDHTAKRGQRGRVLVVDDDRMVTQAIQRSLRDVHDVEAVTDARVALEMLTSGEPYDVVLCDLMMPEMSGMDLYNELSRLAPQQTERIIFLTGGAFTKAAGEFLDRVENRCLEKPFDIAELRSLISERMPP